MKHTHKHITVHLYCLLQLHFHFCVILLCATFLQQQLKVCFERKQHENGTTTNMWAKKIHLALKEYAIASHRQVHCEHMHTFEGAEQFCTCQIRLAYTKEDAKVNRFRFLLFARHTAFEASGSRKKALVVAATGIIKTQMETICQQKCKCSFT